MKTVYNIIFYYIDEIDYRHVFDIGTFSSEQIASETIKKYKNLEGFNKHPEGKFEAVKHFIDCQELPEECWCVIGWNEDEFMDEYDYVYSKQFFCTYEEADEEFLQMYRSLKRDRWIIDEVIIDQCYWDEGFITVQL